MKDRVGSFSLSETLSILVNRFRIFSAFPSVFSFFISASCQTKRTFVVHQELAANVDVPRIDVTLLISIVPAISTAVLVRVRQSEVRVTMMKIR